MTTSRNAEKHNVKVKSSASEKLKKIDEIMNTTGKEPQADSSLLMFRGPKTGKRRTGTTIDALVAAGNSNARDAKSEKDR